MNRIIVENDTMRFYSNPVPIPVGGSQWSKIFFMFSDEWEDLRKIAQFRQGELKRNVDIDSNNFCYVPNEMLPDMCGELSIVGYPQDTSSAVIATTNSLMLSFVQGFESGGEPAVPPTSDLYQKLMAEFVEKQQSDWNQNDENAQDYIKNRPFWYYTTETHIVNADIITNKYGTCVADFALDYGKTYMVSFQGVAYECAVRSFYFPTANTTVYIIGRTMSDGSGFDVNPDDAPFCLYCMPAYSKIVYYEVDEVPISDPNIYVDEYKGLIENYKQIPAKCVPYVQADILETNETLPSFIKNRSAYGGRIYVSSRKQRLNSNYPELTIKGITRGYIYMEGTLINSASVLLSIGNISVDTIKALPVVYELYATISGEWAVILPSGKIKIAGKVGDNIRIDVQNGNVKNDAAQIAVW